MKDFAVFPEFSVLPEVVFTFSNFLKNIYITALSTDPEYNAIVEVAWWHYQAVSTMPSGLHIRSFFMYEGSSKCFRTLLNIKECVSFLKTLSYMNTIYNFKKAP